MFSLAEINSRVVTRRRLIFLSVNLVILSLSASLMVTLLAHRGWTPLAFLLLVAFVLLQLPVVFGFTLAATGFCLLLRGGDPMRINNTVPEAEQLEKLPATAIIMPIFNEEVNRVFQGLQVMYESLRETGRENDFDFLILSDSNDANHWIAEERAWLELCKRVNGFGRIIYRKRRVCLHNKSGNVADFCRRWGARYRYMIVLDADSVMTGPAFVRLVTLMERNRRVGIIQTNPKAFGAKSLFQRIMQFSAHLYGGPYMAGMNFWQLGGGNFWGHNAIIRLEPFMKHCAMPELPKTSPLGTRILSHDTVEAAFMRRAGYGVWFGYDLGGSYEELPPHLLAWLQRDQRWCFGNLQHIWLLFARRIRFANRIHILNGIMGYASSPLWLLFLLLGTIAGIHGSTVGAPAFGAAESFSIRAGILYTYVIALLLLPKVFGTLIYARSPEQVKSSGGRGKVWLGMLMEVVFSTLLAPIQMLFYTRFVLTSLTGKKITWTHQDRDANDAPAWRELISTHFGDACFMLAWAVLVAWLIPDYLPWMALIFIGPLLAIPLSRLTASQSLGQFVRNRGLFLVAEETSPPAELQALETPFTPPASKFFQTRDYAAEYGLLQAILDPYVNAAHVSLLPQRPQVNLRIRMHLNELIARLLLDGPFTLSPKEKRLLLWDADSMELAHFKLWSSPATHLHEWWQAAFRHYNESSALTSRRSVVAL